MEINGITPNLLMNTRVNQSMINEINPDIVKETLEQLMYFQK